MAGQIVSAKRVAKKPAEEQLELDIWSSVSPETAEPEPVPAQIIAVEDVVEGVQRPDALRHGNTTSSAKAMEYAGGFEATRFSGGLVDVPIALYGQNLFGDDILPPSLGPLGQRFLLPPFSVLDARQGYWQERKRAWLALGIQSELGRGAGVWVESETGGPDDRQQRYRDRVSPGGSPRPACDYSDRARGDGTGRPAKFNGGLSAGLVALREAQKQGETTNYAGQEVTGTSVFDPVLCELTYRWFCPPSGIVLDPFAGGSVRGIVAALLGLQYVGIDLSAPQIEANRSQAERICGSVKPTWIVGDSREVEFSKADLIFSCPPYGDLEVYSDDPRDLSVMSNDAFREAYFAIVRRAAQALKDNRFACFVVGEFRGARGMYQGFVADTIAAFRDGGCAFYNDGVLLTAVGSLPIRVAKMFEASRKLGKTHQNYLCFVKGDPVRATEACYGQLDLPIIGSGQGLAD